MQTNAHFYRPPLRLALWLFSIISLVRLGLVAGRPMVFYPNLLDDDDLFVHLAQNIERGNWLGHYNQLTLVKGPGLSILIAAFRTIGIPYELGTQALWCGACLLLLIAFTRIAQSALQFWILFLTGTAVLFHPASYASFDAAVRREAPLYMAQTLAIFAGGVLTIYAHGLKSRLRWGIFTGLILGWLWITREEGVWLAPPMIIFVAWIFVAAWREQRSDGNSNRWSSLLRSAVVAAVPIAAACLVNYSICTLNFIRYRLFCVVEFKVPAFIEAYGALARIGPTNHIKYVPISAAARQLAYQVSPTCRRLEPMLEGPLGKGWSLCSSFYLPADHMSEIGGGHFMWALRDAVYDTWHPKNGAEAMHYYHDIGKEINAAVDDGKIPGGPRRDMMVPSIHRSDWPALATSMRNGMLGIINSGMLSMQLEPSIRTADTGMFGDMLLTFPTPLQDGVNVHLDGWVYDVADRDVKLRLSPAPPGAPPVSVQWTASPDIVAMLGTKATSHAKMARFHLDGQVDPNTRLLFSVNGTDMATLDYGHNQHGVYGPEIFAALDAVSFSDQFGTTAHADQKTLAHHLFDIRQDILIYYQKTGPILFAAGVLAFLAMIAAALSHRRGTGTFFMACLIVLVAMLMRVALLAYIDALVFPAINSQYLAAVYPLMLVFVGMAICGATTWLRKPIDATPAIESV